MAGKKTEKKQEIKLVKMVRQSEHSTIEADVHPDEVENYTAGGWVIKK